MRRWLVRIALTLAAVVAVVIAVAAVVAWRATRVPGWYAAAVDATPPDSDADVALKRRILPLQNWLARSSAGDPAARTEADTVYTLQLTEAEINAMLAKFLDHQHGQVETFRVRLTPGAIDLGFTWAEQGRTVTVTAAVAHTGDGRPTVALGGVRVGNQGVPAAWVSGLPARQMRASLENARIKGRAPRIDDQDAASAHTVEAYYGRLILNVLAGRAVSPEGMLPVRLPGEDWVATRVTALDVGLGTMSVTFRLLTADERAAVVADIAGPLPGS